MDAAPEMDFRTGPIHLRQVAIDDVARIGACLFGGPIDGEEVVTVRPSGFGHHVVADEDLVGVIRVKDNVGFVDRTLIIRPAGNRVGAVNGDRFKVIGRDRNAGVGHDRFPVRSRANLAGPSRRHSSRAMLDRFEGLRNGPGIGITSAGATKLALTGVGAVTVSVAGRLVKVPATLETVTLKALLNLQNSSPVRCRSPVSRRQWRRCS